MNCIPNFAIWHFIASGFILPQIPFPPQHSKGNSSSPYPLSILTTSCCKHTVCQGDTASSDSPCSYPRWQWSSAKCPSYTMQVPYPGRKPDQKDSEKNLEKQKTTFTRPWIVDFLWLPSTWRKFWSQGTERRMIFLSCTSFWVWKLKQKKSSKRSEAGHIKRPMEISGEFIILKTPSSLPQLLRPRNAIHGLTQPRRLFAAELWLVVEPFLLKNVS